jgi:hypothetical protein
LRLIAVASKYISGRSGRGNVGIPKGFPKSVGRWEAALWLSTFPYSVISMACFQRRRSKVGAALPRTAVSRPPSESHHRIGFPDPAKECLPYFLVAAFGLGSVHTSSGEIAVLPESPSRVTKALDRLDHLVV